MHINTPFFPLVDCDHNANTALFEYRGSLRTTTGTHNSRISTQTVTHRLRKIGEIPPYTMYVLYAAFPFWPSIYTIIDCWDIKHDVMSTSVNSGFSARHLIMPNDSIVNCFIIMSRGMRFPTMWYVRPAKTRTSLRICAV